MSESNVRTLRPGFLVNLKTTVRGGVTRVREDIGTEIDADGTEVTRWKTTKTVIDPEEHAKAEKLRSKLANQIRRCCADTEFALLCPLGDGAQLDEAIDAALEGADAFNETARHSNVRIYAFKARVAETDEIATRAIADELTELLGQMEQGIKNVDPEQIRDARTKALQAAKMLVPDQAAKVGGALDAARRAARVIQKRVVKAGEDAETVLRDIRIRPIQVTRFALLGKECPAEETPPALETDGNGQQPLPAVAPQRFAGIEDTPGPLAEDEVNTLELTDDTPPEPDRFRELDDTPSESETNAMEDLFANRQRFENIDDNPSDDEEDSNAV